MSTRPSRLTIVSGGQTGVDRAALDGALTVGLACGGWCPAGRRAEDGPIPARYPLRETPSAEYDERTRWNVRDADATLVLTMGAPTGGTAYTIEVARRLVKPCLVVDLARTPAIDEAVAWVHAGRFEVLNVAGPRESKSESIYAKAYAWCVELFTRLG
ncbi:MAG: putative molybdenum carrier protein [Deltaproteobacteria bacterium]|nr:putative molybdenum carrier protein [Deltaproteobacteria bacterium]